MNTGEMDMDTVGERVARTRPLDGERRFELIRERPRPGVFYGSTTVLQRSVTTRWRLGRCWCRGSGR